MSENIEIEFLTCLDFEKIKKQHNCLLVVGNSCEELYQEKQYLKTATVGGDVKKFIASL